MGVSRLALCMNGALTCVSLGLGPAREGKTALAEQDVVHDRKVGHLKLLYNLKSAVGVSGCFSSQIPANAACIPLNAYPLNFLRVFYFSFSCSVYSCLNVSMNMSSVTRYE